MTYVAPSTFYSTGFYGSAFPGTAFRYWLTSWLSLRFHGAVSTSASFILLLFIYWKFHVTDGQSRSLISRVKQMPTSFRSCCFCLAAPALAASSLLNHSIDTSRCYRIFGATGSSVLHFWSGPPVSKHLLAAVVYTKNGPHHQPWHTQSGVHPKWSTSRGVVHTISCQKWPIPRIVVHAKSCSHHQQYSLEVLVAN